MQEEQIYPPRYIKIKNEMVSVTEEQYRAYVRPAWAERKRVEREGRCRDKNGNRCNDDCSKCTKERTGRPLSIEQLEETGNEVSDSANTAESAINKLCIEKLYDALNELEPENLQIIQMLFFEGLTERQTADRIGLSQKSVNNRKNKIIEKLREYF